MDGGSKSAEEDKLKHHKETYKVELSMGGVRHE